MQVIYLRCCALDVHKKTVVACLLLTQDDGSTRKQVCTFATTTAGLLALADLLERWGIDVVAMESTGIYWRPVFTLVEEGRTIILVNAQHMKAVPGRKTDVKDAEWLADLLRHGLLKASFIPPAPIRDLRDLTRYRKTLGAPCHAGRYLPRRGKELKGRFLGRPSYLEPKGEGNHSMMGTRGTSRGVADELDPLDPHRMAKAKLLELQS